MYRWRSSKFIVCYIAAAWRSRICQQTQCEISGTLVAEASSNGRQWRKEPVEFVKLNYDFHPAWMGEQFADAGLKVRQQFAVSHFRTPLLKRNVSAATLAKVDSWLFGLVGIYPLAPSVFVQAEAEKR